VLAGIVFASLGILLSCIPTSRGTLGAGLGLLFVMMMLSGSGPLRGRDQRHAPRQRHPPAHPRKSRTDQPSGAAPAHTPGPLSRVLAHAAGEIISGSGPRALGGGPFGNGRQIRLAGGWWWLVP
jgi:hypothetical protein